MFRKFMTIWSALRQAPAGGPCLIFPISASSTAMFVASWLARLSRRTMAVQVEPHGKADDAFGWRSRNPIMRWFDLGRGFHNSRASLRSLESLC
jgi:hypothetical protein